MFDSIPALFGSAHLTTLAWIRPTAKSQFTARLAMHV